MKHTPQEAAAIVARYRRTVQVQALLDSCFPEQRNFVLDPSRMKAVLCSRRAGKSWGSCIMLLVSALNNPGSSNVYIGINRVTARDTVWSTLKTLCQQHHIEAQFHETDLRVRLDNGSQVIVGGYDYNESARDKLLGQHFKLVVIDECQSWETDVWDLVKTIKPAMTDDKGTICLTGTPGEVKNFFHDVVMKQVTEDGKKLVQPGWSTHSWTTFQNTKHPGDWQGDIDEEVRLNPNIIEQPWFRRFYYGEWVTDSTNRVYRWDRKYAEKALPELVQGDRWIYAMGADLGTTDDAAIVVVAWNQTEPVLHVVGCWAEPQHDLTSFANKARELKARFNTTIHVIDTGGLGKMITLELNRRHGIQWEATLKEGGLKTAGFGIDLMNDDFNHDRIRVVLPECEALANEWEELVWDSFILERKNKRIELAKCKNHMADACLYVWRKSRHFRSNSGRVTRPLTIAEEMWQRHLERNRKKRDLYPHSYNKGNQ